MPLFGLMARSSLGATVSMLQKLSPLSRCHILTIFESTDITRLASRVVWYARECTGSSYWCCLCKIGRELRRSYLQETPTRHIKNDKAKSGLVRGVNNDDEGDVAFNAARSVTVQ